MPARQRLPAERLDARPVEAGLLGVGGAERDQDDLLGPGRALPDSVADRAVPPAVPLALAAAPFVARLYEAALRQVDADAVEAAKSFGASRWQLVWRVLLPEALPGLVTATTVMVVSLVGYSAMAGAVGGGGLGDLGIRFGYQRFQPAVMAAVVIVLIALVNALQWAGDRLARRLSRGKT